MYSNALSLAGSVGDPVLSAHVLELSSMLSSHVARAGGSRGLAREGLRLADQAGEAARHEPMPRLHALISLRRANAVSLLGDGASFQSAIAHARRQLDSADTEDPGWIRFVDESEIATQEAVGYQNLGDPATAAVLHQRGLDYPGQSRRNRACGHAQFAAALAEAGDASGAVSEGIEVLPALSAGVTSIRTLNYLRRVRTVAERSGAEEFCTRFDAIARQLST